MCRGRVVANNGAVARNLPAGACAILLLATCGAPEPAPETLPAIDLGSLAPGLAEDLGPLLAAVGDRPADAGAAGEAGMLLQAHQQHTLSVPFFERARSLEPNELRWEYYLGVAHASLGEHADAAARFRRCVEIDPNFVPARKRLAQANLEQERTEEGRDLFHALHERLPDDPHVRYGLGKAEAALGRHDEAVEHLVRAVGIAPTFGAAHYSLALVYREQGMLSETRRHMQLFEEHRHSAPPDDDPLQQAVRSLRTSAASYLQRGTEAQQAGRTREAIRLNLRALEEEPGLLQAHINLLILYGSVGEAEAATDHYRRGVASGEESAELHYNYGVLADRSGDRAEAERAFRRALEINADHASANHNLGQMLEERGRFDEAMDHYRRALENRPDHALAHYKVGMLWMRKRRANEARAAFEEAVKEQSDRTPTYLFSLAAACLAAGDERAALANFREARRLAQTYSQTDLIERIDAALAQMGASERGSRPIKR